MLLFQSDLALLSFWQTHVLRAEEDLTVQVARVNNIFVQKNHLFDSKPSACHGNSTPESSNAKQKTYLLLNFVLVPILNPNLSVKRSMRVWDLRFLPLLGIRLTALV
jgi:hypothetical protein